MNAGDQDGQSLSTRLSQFLLCYRSSPHATTNRTPSELFLRRKIRTRFDLLKPDTQSFVTSKQAQQKMHYKSRQFSTGQPVMVKDFRSSRKWIPGMIVGRS